MPQEVAVRNVLLALAATGELPAESAGLRQILEPVLCQRVEDRQILDRGFAAVFGIIPVVPPPPPPLTKQPARIWPWLVAVCCLLLALAAWQFWPRPSAEPITSTPPLPPITQPTDNTTVTLPEPVNPATGPVTLVGYPQWAPSWSEPFWKLIPTAWWPWVPHGLGALAGLSLLILGIAVARRSQHRYLNRRLISAAEAAEEDVIFQVPIRSPFPEAVLRQASQELRRHRVVDALHHLDLPATVRASVKAGGWFTPVGARVLRTPEYLVLIQEETGADHRAHLARFLATQLAADGVPVRVWTFRGAPDYLYPGDGDAADEPFSLDELHVRHPEARLLLFAEWDGESQWEKNGLELWENGGAWFAERHAADAVAPGLRRMGEGYGGFTAYVGLLRGGTGDAPARDHRDLPTLMTVHRERWLSATPPAPAEISAGLGILADYLGRSGMKWLRACAAYPELDWNLTIALGRRINSNSEFRNSNLASDSDPQLLSRLVALPWFERGAMPSWLRRTLLKDLGSKDRRQVDAWLNEILVEGAAQASGDEAARTQVHHLVAKNPGLVQRLGRQLRRKSSQWQDATTLDWLGSWSAFGIKVPQMSMRPLRVGAGVLLMMAALGWGGNTLYHRLTKQSPFPTDPTDQSDQSDKVAPPPEQKQAPQQIVAPAYSATNPFTNSLQMKFVPIPGTTTLMSVWETRVQDYAEFAKENPGINMEWKDNEYEGHKQTLDHPVVKVSHDDAKAFCDWLSKKEGRTYRLPTDHEWSLAVGIGDREDPKQSPEEKDAKLADVYPWGSTWPPPAGSGNFSGSESESSFGKIEGYTDPFPFTAPVGSFKLEHNGIKDLSGNVWEWCEDKYSPSSSAFVLRGGSWRYYARENALSSYRHYYEPSSRYYYLGFRCVLVGEAAGAEAR